MADPIPAQPPSDVTTNTSAPVLPAASVPPIAPPITSPTTTVPVPQAAQTPSPASFPQPIVNPLPDDLSAQWRRTKCLNCGYIHEGTTTLTTCPRCGNTDPDKFQEAD